MTQALEGFSDSSSRRTAGIFTSVGLGEFVCTEELSDVDLNRHINEKEGVALRKLIEAIFLNYPQQIEEAGVLCRVDSKVLFDTYNNQGSNNIVFITNVCKELFWLQINFSFILKL